MEYKSLFILGRQPAIGIAELESLLGSDNIKPVDDGQYAVLSTASPDEVPFSRIGSSIRLARPVATFNNGKWADVGRKVVKAFPQIVDTLPLEGKIKVGISCFGLSVSTNDLLRTGLELKKAAKKLGRSMRVVPNNALSLNTAQVLHNKLDEENGVELLIIANGEDIILAQTLSIQDIDDYAHRDRTRPKRDSFVGMLPPKLAQTIVNLGVAKSEASEDFVVLDPFCGTGVVLQESLLMGFGAYGTDLQTKMIEYTTTNLEWLKTYTEQSGRNKVSENIRLEVGDAMTHSWQGKISAVACEGYLGHPLSQWPTPEKLREIMGTCDMIATKFLRNIAKQIPSGTRLCLALPAWQGPDGRLYHLSTLDQIEDLGYNRVSFQWASWQDMVYRRPDQMVARELLVITRK